MREYRTMGLKVNVQSTLGGGLLLSLIAYFGGTYAGRPELTELARPFVFIFGAIWGIFILFTLIRNFRSL